MKKSLLLVVKDQLEAKFLTNRHFLPQLVGAFDVTLMCPANWDPSFREAIRSEYPEMRFLGHWPDSQVRFIDQVVYWLKSELFFILNSRKSESCFQKAFFNLDAPLSLLLRTNLDRALVRILSPIFNNWFPERLMKAPIAALALGLKPLERWMFRHNSFATGRNGRRAFDYILFGRPNSLVNIPVFRSYANPNTRLITVCRNFDTPALKGIFSVPAHCTLIFDRYLCEHLRWLNHTSNYGAAILCEHPVKFFRKNHNSSKKQPIKVLYATALRHHVPDEPQTARRLYSFLFQTLGTDFRLFLRVHPSDDHKRYTNLLRKPNVFLEEDANTNTFGTYRGDREFFPPPAEIERFYARLQQMDLVLSTGSTINYEAHILGVKAAYLKLTRDLEWVYKRDHLRILKEKHLIPVITNLRDLTGLIA